MVESDRVEVPDPSGTSAAVTVIVVDERLPASADVASVIESASGTVVRRLGGLGDFSAISIRGSSFRQVQVYLDGLPLNPDGSHAVNLSELPLSAFSRVELYRGSAPPELAATPIGGVINLVTPDTDPTAPVGSGSTGSLSYGQLQTMRLTAAVDQRPVLVLAEAFSTRGDFGYFTDNGTIYNVFDDARLERENNEKSQLNAYVRWRVGGESLRLTVADAFLARAEGLPGSVNTPAATPQLDTWRSLGAAQLEGRSGAVRWQTRLWHLGRLEQYDDRQGEIGVGNQWQEGRYQTVGLLGHGAWAATPWLVPALTLSARRDRTVLADLLLEETEPPRRRTALTAAASADVWLWQEQVRLSPVVQAGWLDNRLLHLDTETAPVAGRDTLLTVNPRMGLLIRPAPLSALALKANAGSYVRPPDMTELFGDRGGIIGNSELLPEQGWQWDTGFRLSLPETKIVQALSLDGMYFWSAVEDQIVFVQNSQRTSVPVNFGRTRTDGIEAAVTVSLLGWLDSQSNLTWTRSENLAESPDVAGNQLPRIPTWEAYQGTSLHWDEHIRLGHTFSYTDGNYWDATNFFRAVPRALHGAFLRLGLPRRLSLEASVLNLTNQTVVVMDRNPLSSDDDTPTLQPLTDFIGYPLPGRTWLLTLRWTP